MSIRLVTAAGWVSTPQECVTVFKMDTYIEERVFPNKFRFLFKKKQKYTSGTKPLKVIETLLKTCLILDDDLFNWQYQRDSWRVSLLRTLGRLVFSRRNLENIVRICFLISCHLSLASTSITVNLELSSTWSNSTIKKLRDHLKKERIFYGVFVHTY